MVLIPSSCQWNSLLFNRKGYLRFIFIITIGVILVSCNQITSLSTSNPKQTIVAQPTIPLSPTNSATETLTPLPSALPTQNLSFRFGFPPYLPEKMRLSFTLPEGYSQAATYKEASIEIDVEYGDADPVIQWIYALVAPFPTITDGITSETTSK